MDENREEWRIALSENMEKSVLRMAENLRKIKFEMLEFMSICVESALPDTGNRLSNDTEELADLMQNAVMYMLEIIDNFFVNNEGVLDPNSETFQYLIEVIHFDYGKF